MKEMFNFKTLQLKDLHSCAAQETGIILEVDEISMLESEMIRIHVSQGNSLGLCIISQKFQMDVFQMLSLEVPIIWFLQTQLEADYKNILQKIELFFTKNANALRYMNSLKIVSKTSPINSLSIVAHQWRQPINLISMEAINLMIQANMQECVKSSLLTESLELISNQTQRMSDILKSVLELGKENRFKREFKVNEILKKIEAFFLDEFTPLKITLSTSYLKEDYTIYGLQTDLEEVLINIITNAKDAYKTFDDTSKEIKIIPTLEDAFVIIKIIDGAGGIPKAIREKIFESNFSTKEKGFGIGLHLAKLIMVQEFKGSLSLKVNNTKTEFIVAIPRNDKNNLKYIK